MKIMFFVDIETLFVSIIDTTATKLMLNYYGISMVTKLHQLIFADNTSDNYGFNNAGNRKLY